MTNPQIGAILGRQTKTLSAIDDLATEVRSLKPLLTNIQSRIEEIEKRLSQIEKGLKED